MDKELVRKLLGIAFSNWNDRVPAKGHALDDIISAWQIALSGISYEDAVKAINHLAVTEVFLPRPFTVRKTALILSGAVKPPPTGPSAWGIMRHVARDVNTGAIQPEKLHECVIEAIRRMGGFSSISVDTNGDRNFFLEVYGGVLKEWEVENYGISE